MTNFLCSAKLIPGRLSYVLQPVYRPCIALQRQEEERGRKAREEKDKHLYTVIKAARAQDLHDQIGNTLFWDIVDFEQARPPLVPIRQLPLVLFLLQT